MKGSKQCPCPAFVDFPRWQSIFACRVGKDRSWLSCLLTEQINHPYTLEDTFPDCVLGTSSHKLRHILLCILLLTGHRRISTAYFCRCLMGKVHIFPLETDSGLKRTRENDPVLPKISIFSKICSWLMIFLTCPNLISWCIKQDIITDNLPWSPLILLQIISPDLNVIVIKHQSYCPGLQPR